MTSGITFVLGYFVGGLCLIFMAQSYGDSVKEALFKTTGKHHVLRWVPVEEAEEKEAE